MSDDRNVDETTGHDAAQGEPMAAGHTMTAEPEELSEEVAVLGEESFVEQNTGQARLVVKRSGAEAEDSFDLNPPCVIGRFDPGVGPVDVDLGPLPEGVYVSRKHARITCDDGVWAIEDMGSSNGTFILLNGSFEKVDRYELVDGTEFALGNARFVFHLS